MSMSRKDFEAIAAALKGSLPSDAEPDGDLAFQHVNCCEAVADALANANPRFDRGRFLEACGVKLD